MTSVTIMLRPGLGSQWWLQVVFPKVWYVEHGGTWNDVKGYMDECNSIYIIFKLGRYIINTSYSWLHGYYFLEWAKLKNNKLIWSWFKEN